MAIHCQKMRTENCAADERSSARVTCRRVGGEPTHKLVLLAELVQFGVAVEHARSDELVEDAEHDGRQDGKDDVVEGEGPALLEHLAGERVLEGELRAARTDEVRLCVKQRRGREAVRRDAPRSRSCTGQCSCRSCDG